jgi:hypothetical protein
MPQHRNGAIHHYPYVNENMERFRAMEQQKRMVAQHMKPIHHQHPQHPMGGPMGSTPYAPSPGQQQPLDQQEKREAVKKGPDITMDAASMLLALRTSASPSTVSAATLEEQASRDQSETSKKMAISDQQDHDDLDDDDVPALSSSSSSLSAPPKHHIHCHEVPKDFPTRLALPNDEAKLNSLHCFLRSELLEIFVVERSANKSPTHSPGSSVGRVGLRCVFCAMARKRSALSTTDEDVSSTSQQQRADEAPMAVFYPKSIAEIYRLVTSWQRCHLRKCRNLPPDIRSKWTLLRENDKSRGKTHYWITSAKEIGLTDCQSRAGGIRFVSPARTSSEASGSIAKAMETDSLGDGLYNQTSSEDVFRSAAESYQPRSNPNFLEGPSQKQREAISSVASSAPISAVESPLKSDSQPLSAVESPLKSHSESAKSAIVPIPTDPDYGSGEVLSRDAGQMEMEIGSDATISIAI